MLSRFRTNFMKEPQYMGDIALIVSLLKHAINLLRSKILPVGQCHLVKGKNKATIELTGEHLFFVATKYKTQWLKQI